MANPQKRKGDEAERRVAAWLAAHGWPYAERQLGAGRKADVGDIAGLPGIVVEVKNHRTLALSAWLRELDAETVNARAEHGVLVVKRKGVSNAGQWYAVTTLDDWARLATEAGWSATDDTTV